MVIDFDVEILMENNTNNKISTKYCLYIVFKFSRPNFQKSMKSKYTIFRFYNFSEVNNFLFLSLIHFSLLVVAKLLEIKQRKTSPASGDPCNKS